MRRRVFILEIDKGRQRCHNQKDRSDARGQRAAEKKKKKERKREKKTKGKTKQFAGKRPITSAHASKRCIFRERLYKKKKRRNSVKIEQYTTASILDPKSPLFDRRLSSFLSIQFGKADGKVIEPREEEDREDGWASFRNFVYPRARFFTLHERKVVAS